MTTTIPRSLSDITADWMTQALAVEVSNVAVRKVVGGTATKVLLDVDYAGTASPLPTQMCFKGGLGEHAQFMAPVGIYATEARFFRDERPHLRLKMPEVFWADVDNELFGGILMEDLTRPSVRFCSALTPLSADEVAGVLDNVAGLHAARWNSPWLKTADWLEHFANPDSRGRAYFSMLGAEVVAEFIEKRRDILPADLRDPQHCLDLFWGFVAKAELGPQVLLHGDLHVGNVYFDGNQAGLCDWQVLGRGSPAFDLSYLLGSAMTTQERRDNERELLRHYLSALKSTGIEDAPGCDELWALYRVHMAYGMFAWLTNPEAFQAADIIGETLARLAAAVVDLDTAHAVGVH